LIEKAVFRFTVFLWGEVLLYLNAGTWGIKEPAIYNQNLWCWKWIVPRSMSLCVQDNKSFLTLVCPQMEWCSRLVGGARYPDRWTLEDWRPKCLEGRL